MAIEEQPVKFLSSVEAKAVLEKTLPSSVSCKKIGGKTVIEKLVDAIGSEKVLLTEDGHITTPNSAEGQSSWVYVKPSKKDPRQHYKSCKFLFNIAYDVLYDEHQIPQGCEHCYKVKVEVDNVYALKKLRELSKAIPWSSKFGPEIENAYSQSIYSGFFYVDGLNQAHDAYYLIKSKISQDEDLINCSKMTIKRGCTPYEIKLGASDNWQFDSSFDEVEDALYALFKPAQKNKPHSNMSSFLKWLLAAFRIGDDSYLKLTNGKRIYPKMVDYKPED